MNTNKSYFAELTKQTRYISLNNSSNQFLVEPLFRQKILSLVDDPSFQISCNFGLLGEFGEYLDGYQSSNVDQIRIFDCKARTLSSLTSVESVENQTCDSFVDFNSFAHVKGCLSFSHVGCHYEISLYDLSCLSSSLSLCPESR
jgi:hypothetical protein